MFVSVLVQFVIFAVLQVALVAVEGVVVALHHLNAESHAGLKKLLKNSVIGSPTFQHRQLAFTTSG